MQCEKMSVDLSIVKNESLESEEHNLSAASSELSIDLKCSWSAAVCEAESEMNRNSNLINDPNKAGRSQDYGGCMVPEERLEEKYVPTREIKLEFMDDANEQKFERLIKEEKLKTPFKRRHSHTNSIDSRSNSPNSFSSSDTDNERVRFDSRKNEKRTRQNSLNSSSSSASTECDPAVLSRRQKQIDYGKNTAAYERYLELIPKAKRTRDHPRTPNKYGKYSRRAFDGLVKIWRKQLHYYDPPINNDANEENNSSSEDSDSE